MLMQITTHYAGTIRYIRSHWPNFLFGYGGGLLISAVIVWISGMMGWYSFVILGFLAIFIIPYFSLTSIWSAHKVYDKHRISAALNEIGNLHPEDILVHIDLGRRDLAIELCRYMTTGRVIVIDVYNPQMTPSRELARARRQAKRPEPDPRLSWRDGNISLLPLPDCSVPVVSLSEVASEFWQLGDRQQLFKEVFRILRPGGHVLLAERLRTPTNILIRGPAGLRLAPLSYWDNLLSDAGFRLKKHSSLDELICIFKADKPAPEVEEQLPFVF